MHSCKHKANINKTMKFELKIIIEVLSYPKKYILEAPTVHLFHREPDFFIYGDTCLEAGGGLLKHTLVTC